MILKKQPSLDDTTDYDKVQCSYLRHELFGFSHSS